MLPDYELHLHSSTLAQPIANNGIFWRTVKSANGDSLLFLVNVSKETNQIKVSKGGSYRQLTNKLTNQSYGDSITIPPQGVAILTIQ
ncbi:hypothetical protein RS130_09930 [Paraglaciecola aquimarina]|uniref:Maltogenic Amylase C-terminal domain-containing protein n=1 Tax=Paraglaciecola aquimarina TaxID=1235557 RepID=A0ABU3SW22_9ALTE|nr:hypothetical protein [Paraglaciecola aquimarina]MDU0354211.1 hypothetical protein [Paraglaciecola aquimarina]